MQQAAVRVEAAPPANIAATLAGFAARLTYDAIPEPVRQRAKHLILDATGIALASSRHEFARRALAGMQARRDQGEVPVIGCDERLTARDAATLNGILCHGLDYDDTHPSISRASPGPAASRAPAPCMIRPSWTPPCR